MQTLDGSAADDPPDEALPPPSPPPATPADGHPVIGGVALDLAMRFGVDPVWPRLAFVALTIFLDGFGLLVYVGLWLVLIVGRRPGWAAIRLVGTAVLVGSLFLLEDLDGPWIDSPWGLAALLAGAALALWAPRGIPVRAGPVIDHALADGRAGATPAAREASVLGRSALGVAFVVAAVGALVDQLNGGRLHPEQWLGAAAAVCGVGMLVGAWRGRGLWLLVPGLLFAGGGFLAGHAARAGVDSPSFGHEDVWVDAGTEGPANSTRAAGTARLTVIDAPPNTPVRSDLRVGIGQIEIDVEQDVTVEVHPTVHDGQVRVDGEVRSDSTITLGPDGEPDVIVDAEISLGDIEIERIDVEPEIPPLPEIPVEPAFDLGEGLQMAVDGTVLLPDGIGAIGPDGEVWTPYATPRRADGVTVISTTYGDFLLLPNQMIITPSGALIDVPARRRELVPTTTTVGGG